VVCPHNYHFNHSMDCMLALFTPYNVHLFCTSCADSVEQNPCCKTSINSVTQECVPSCSTWSCISVSTRTYHWPVSWDKWL